MITKVKVFAHSQDRNVFRFEDANGDVRDIEGYAPYITNFSGGDDLEFEIDNATGKIIGWIPLTYENLENM